MTSEAFRTRDLTKLYGSTLALDKVTVKAPKKAVGLLGPNGAGKTTLIRILMGIIRHSSGSGGVLGLDFKDSVQEIRDRVGYSPEFTPIIPEVSAMKYVTFMGRLSGLPSVEAAQRAHDTLHYVGLDEERYRPLKEFSAGMMQKCKLAAALVHDPELVILDEPTDGLDPTGRHQMLELIQKLYREEEKSLIVSSHLLFDVEKVCDWVVILGRGQVVTTGNMDELLADTTGMLRLKIAGDAEEFAKKLTARGLDTQVEGAFVDVKKSDGTEMIVLEEVNKDSSVSLRYMGRRTQTLEDVFVSLVEGRSDME
ncbi:MAG: ABC transporter ATP-binding protein [Candidatus Thorarchaeota archaeon]